MRRRALVFLFGASLVVAASCTRDFDAFDVHGNGAFAPDGGAGTGTTDASGSQAGGASTGGSSLGSGGGGAGNAGAFGGADAQAGTGGASRDASTGGRTDSGSDAAAGGASSTGGAANDGSSGSDGDSGAPCSPQEKACGAQCAALDSPATGCASASCLACSLPNTLTYQCITGACATNVCQGGYGDCNGTASDGCEHDVTGDPLKCGACARSCAGDHVESRACNGGACSSTCDPGRANCARPTVGPDDGCEVDATADSRNCGGCGNDCTMQNGKSCAAGLCGCTADMQCRSGTQQGTTTCDAAAGLCHCNAATCTHGESCRNGACACNGQAACAASDTCCRSPLGCRNLMTDAGSCGACGRACAAGFVCVSGGCQCNADGDCNLGTPGTCGSGVCHCGATTCGTGERCLPSGRCG